MPNSESDADSSLDHLWQWGLHEDDLLSNRLGLLTIAEALLITAAVLSLSSSNAGSLRGLIIVAGVAGIALCVVFWNLPIVQLIALRSIQHELKEQDPLYSHVHKQFDQHTKEAWLPKRLGTWLLSRYTSPLLIHSLCGVLLVVWGFLIGTSFVVGNTPGP